MGFFCKESFFGLLKNEMYTKFHSTYGEFYQKMSPVLQKLISRCSDLKQECIKIKNKNFFLIIKKKKKV